MRQRRRNGTVRRRRRNAEICARADETEPCDCVDDAEPCDGAEETEASDNAEKAESPESPENGILPEVGADDGEAATADDGDAGEAGDSAVQIHNGGDDRNPRISELRAEKERNLRKIAEITAQNERIDAQITELENTEIIRIVREGGITPDQLDKLIAVFKRNSEGQA